MRKIVIEVPAKCINCKLKRFWEGIDYCYYFKERIRKGSKPLDKCKGAEVK